MPRHAMTPHFSGCTIDAQVIPLMFNARFGKHELAPSSGSMLRAVHCLCQVRHRQPMGIQVCTFHACSQLHDVSTSAKPGASCSAADLCRVLGSELPGHSATTPLYHSLRSRMCSCTNAFSSDVML